MEGFAVVSVGTMRVVELMCYMIGAHKWLDEVELHLDEPRTKLIFMGSVPLALCGTSDQFEPDWYLELEYALK